MVVIGGNASTRVSATVLPATAVVGAPPEFLDASMAMAEARRCASSSSSDIVSLGFFGFGFGNGNGKELW